MIFTEELIKKLRPTIPINSMSIDGSSLSIALICNDRPFRVSIFCDSDLYYINFGDLYTVNHVENQNITVNDALKDIDQIYKLILSGDLSLERLRLGPFKSYVVKGLGKHFYPYNTPLSYIIRKYGKSTATSVIHI